MPKDVSTKAFRRYLLGVKSESTARKYASYAGLFLRLMRANGYQTFSEIPPGLLSELASMLTHQKKSPSTVRVHVYAVKKYLEWVQAQGVEVATQARVDLPRRDIRMREVLPPDQISNYFRSADLELEEPMRTAVMLLPCCGLRASEMVSVKLEDIKKARVRLQGGKHKTTLFLQVLGKGNKERHVPLMEEGVEILTGYLAGWRRRQRGPWLFPRVTKSKAISGRKHVTDRLLRGALQKMREPMGMDFTPQTMRRTYITTLHRKKVDLATIRQIAGHANVQTTLDHYIAIEPTDAVRAVHEAGSALTE